MDVTGKTVKKEALNTETKTIYIGDLANGLYIVTIANNNGKQISKKVVSEHEHELTIYNQREIKIHFTNNIIGKLDETDKITKNLLKSELIIVCLQEKTKENYTKLVKTLEIALEETPDKRVI